MHPEEKAHLLCLLVDQELTNRRISFYEDKGVSPFDPNNIHNNLMRHFLQERPGDKPDYLFIFLILTDLLGIHPSALSQFPELSNLDQADTYPQEKEKKKDSYQYGNISNLLQVAQEIPPDISNSDLEVLIKELTDEHDAFENIHSETIKNLYRILFSLLEDE